MERSRIFDLASTPEALEQTVSYLTDRMSVFLKKGERVLICYDDEPYSLGHVFAQAVKDCGAIPLTWGSDRRWKTLLRQAFFHKVHTIIAEPLVVLGLTKLARAMATPLYVRNVVTASYPFVDWMIDGIVNGLDCKTWGCFDWHGTCVVAGFSCGCNRGLHLREDYYGVRIVDGEGNDVPEGNVGRVELFDRRDPEIRCPTIVTGRLDRAGCRCGCPSGRLVDINPGPHLDLQLINAAQEIMRWTSVLDCKITRGDAGLEIEILVFPGEQLPQLPSCAKLIVRPWEPDVDEPFHIINH